MKTTTDSASVGLIVDHPLFEQATKEAVGAGWQASVRGSGIENATIQAARGHKSLSLTIYRKNRAAKRWGITVSAGGTQGKNYALVGFRPEPLEEALTQYVRLASVLFL